MPKVFRSTQIETTKIILSGGVGSSGIGGLIYSGSVATDMVGGIPASMLTNVGPDTMLFVSGVIGGKGSSGVVVFGGDTVVSGSLTVGTGSITITSNEVRFQGGVAKITSSSSGLTFFDSGNTAGVSLSTLLSAVQPVYFSSTTNKAIFTTGSAAFKGDDVGVDSPTDKGSDVFFYVSGSVSGSGSQDKRALFGGDVVISGSLRQGNLNNATGLYSHAEGIFTVASGEGSHAEGISSVASGNSSHAEGDGSFSVGSFSHAEGVTTVANGEGSHAEGNKSKTFGEGSHAEGESTHAVGDFSHSEGIYTIASGSGQHVSGKYNKRGNDFSLFVIGDGSGDADANRSDILRVNSGLSAGKGQVEITGSLAATLGLSGSLTKLTDGTSYLIAGSNVTITSSSNGSVTISSSGGGGGGGSSYFTDPTSGFLNTTGSLTLAGALGSSYVASTAGNDVFFFISGSKSSKGTSTRGVSLVGGDLHISGNLSLEGTTTGLKPNHVFNEYLGQGDGSNTLFTLDYTPTANKNVSIFVNGLLQMTATAITGAPYQDYSVTGSNIYFTSASIPDVDSVIIANYLTNDSI